MIIKYPKRTNKGDEELDYYSTLIQHIHDEYRKRVR